MRTTRRIFAAVAAGYVIHFDEDNFPTWKNRISSFIVHGRYHSSRAKSGRG
ncbi:hypothetical protein ACFV4N_06365 [Actinosynnema sp. NPDC059797]